MDINQYIAANDTAAQIAEAAYYDDQEMRDTFGPECDVDREDRRFVDESDVEDVTDAERQAIETVIAVEEYDEPYDEGYYYSGSGEWSEDDSYIDYLNRH